MNILLNPQLHWLPLVFIRIEVIFLAIQLWEIFKHPHDRRQWWYLILLVLLLCFNWANGLFPDSSSAVPIKLQYMLAYGSAYLIGAYFPFYFYKNFRLKRLRFYATYGVCLFLLLPYLVFNVLLYALNGRLVFDREWGVLVPAAYGIVVLIAIFRAITRKRRESTEWAQYREALAVWVAILPWEAMSVFAFYPVPKDVHILLANLGWVVITFLMMAKGLRRTWHDHDAIRKLHFKDIDQLVLEANCILAGFTKRETEITLLLRERYSDGQIAMRLFLSPWTVKTHIRNARKKAGVNSRVELVLKLGSPDWKPGK
jgi:DNA-binding CsgD family transcriptional regulator